MTRVILKKIFRENLLKKYRPTDRPNHRPDPTRPDIQNRWSVPTLDGDYKEKDKKTILKSCLEEMCECIGSRSSKI